jgi:DNA-binding NtrC family response regulator
MRFAVETFRVLVVDDEVDFLETLVNRLKRRKLEAEGASSGEEALELMKGKHFDVVVLDIKMPGGLDGIETLREIRRIGPLTEVILLTGHASLETSIEGMKLGAFDYLLKPVKLEELMPKLAAAFEKKAAQEEKIRKAKIREIGSPGEPPQNDED